MSENESNDNVIYSTSSKNPILQHLNTSNVCSIGHPHSQAQKRCVLRMLVEMLNVNTKMFTVLLRNKDKIVATRLELSNSNTNNTIHNLIELDWLDSFGWFIQPNLTQRYLYLGLGICTVSIVINWTLNLLESSKCKK